MNPINKIDKNDYINLTKEELNQKLECSFREGNLEIIKYILTSPDLKEHPNINDKDRGGWTSLMYATIFGKLDIVKYLLTSPDLKEHADIYVKDNDGYTSLICACIYGHIEIVKYLLTSPELKEHADIYVKDNDCKNAFMWASHNDHLDVVKFLIIDMDVDVDNETMIWLQGENDKKEVYHQVLKLIETKDLHNKLDNSISDDKINNKKIKL